MVNDYAATAFIGTAQRGGIRVPEDVSVVSHADMPIARHGATPLTTMTHPVEIIARHVVELLASRLESRHADPPREIVVRANAQAERAPGFVTLLYRFRARHRPRRIQMSRQTRQRSRGAWSGFTLIEPARRDRHNRHPRCHPFPVFAQAREKARQTACLSNAKQVSLGFMQYVQDYDEMYPSSYFGVAFIVTQPYMKNKDIWRCPPTRGIQSRRPLAAEGKDHHWLGAQLRCHRRVQQYGAEVFGARR